MVDVEFLKNKGKVLFDDFNISIDDELKDHVYDLKEDMLQIEFLDNYILDIGWRPSFDLSGKFFITAVKNYNWESPQYLSSALNINELNVKLASAWEVINN